ncbi:MAG: hypothetical protein WC729_07010 [Sphingomonas sp.]|jgi:hypothetical protein|uniref:hypothetical protein n=1 Tax=Sphingomonas sp. TaxID=28214 RepID=UPI003568A631
MYRYLDRAIRRLDEPEQFLLVVMRTWVGAARAGRCCCHALHAGFAGRGIAEALPDFNMMMVTLDQDGFGHIRFGAAGSARVTDDEARMLALFAVAREGPIARLKRVAAGLVVEGAVARLAQSADFVATALGAGTTTGNATGTGADRS